MTHVSLSTFRILPFLLTPSYHPHLLQFIACLRSCSETLSCPPCPFLFQFCFVYRKRPDGIFFPVELVISSQVLFQDFSLLPPIEGSALCFGHLMDNFSLLFDVSSGNFIGSPLERNVYLIRSTIAGSFPLLGSLPSLIGRETPLTSYPVFTFCSPKDSSISSADGFFARPRF